MSQYPQLNNPRYEIKSQLGQGGFSTMYKARDKKRNRSCVIKELALDRAHDWKSIELFEREAKILANLDHPNIPDFVDNFTIETDEQTQFFLVQEYVNGKSLKDWIRDGKHYTEKEVLKMGLKLAEVLEYLHAFSPPIIHRDIKPGNVMLKPDQTTYLVDFGSVKDQLLSQSKEQGSTVVGTFGYMPIEQFEGRASVSSDIYALGMTLIYALSHIDPKDMNKKGLKIDFKPHVNISNAFFKLLDQMVEPDSKQRIQSASDLKRQFENLIEGKKNVTTVSKGKSRTGSPILGIFITAVFLAVGGGVFGYLSISKTPKKTSYLTADTYLKMGKKSSKKSSYGVAIIHLSKAIELNPKMAEAYYERANAYLGKKKSHDAIKDFNTAISLKPDYPEAFNDLGVAYKRIRLNQKALESYNRALELNQHYELALRNRAQLYGDLGQHQKSIDEYSKLIKIDNSKDLHRDFNERGVSYLALKKTELAKKDFEQSNKLNPEYKFPYYNLGILSFNAKDYKKAISYFDLAILKDSKYISAYNDRGRAYLNLNDLIHAEENFKHTLLLDPKYYTAYNNIGYVYQVKKEYTKAIDYYSKALKIRPKYSLGLVNRGNSYKALNLCDRAKKDYKDSCDLGNTIACDKTCP